MPPDESDYWVAQQVMAAGVHRILLCHAENAEAVKILVEALRYPFAPKHPGARNRSQGERESEFRFSDLGLPASEYMRKADVWPLNKNGEVLLGLKIETPMAADNAAKTTLVPGIGFAEWGPGDQSLFLIGAPAGEARGDRESHPAMKQIRSRIFREVKAAGLFFLNSCNENNVLDMLKEGVMICTGGETHAADKGRAFTKWQGPW